MQDVSFWCCSVWTMGFWIFYREKLDILSNFRQAFWQVRRVLFVLYHHDWSPPVFQFRVHFARTFSSSFYFSGICNQVPRVEYWKAAAFGLFGALPLEYRAKWMPSFAYYYHRHADNDLAEIWNTEERFLIITAFKKKNERKRKLAVRNYCCI